MLKQLKVKDAKRFRLFDKMISMAPWLLGQICKLAHVDIPQGSRITVRTIVKSGFGIDGGICLGWADTKARSAGRC